jgi:hypothetical protein
VRPAEQERPTSDRVHGYFGLTYANYLVEPRSLLQSMPDEWQERFISCLEELDEAYRHLDRPPFYSVQARNYDGKITRDPAPHYNRGRTFVPPNPSSRLEGVESD